MEMVNREEWLPQLSSMRSMKSIRVKDIDFKSDKFSTVVEKIGRNLTVLDLKDICYFRLVRITLAHFLARPQKGSEPKQDEAF